MDGTWMALTKTIQMHDLFGRILRSRVSGGLHKPGHRQPRDVGNIIVGESPAHSQHGAASLQENIAALDRHHAGHIRNYAELMI
jgi:hypothetical protein